MNVTPVVKQLLIINIIFFIGTQIVPIAETYFALHYFENPLFQFWQPLTHMFMHGNLMHIFFNMFALYSFGSTLENFWGWKKFLFFYISCGLGAAFIYTAVNYFQNQYIFEQLSSLNLSKTDIQILLNADYAGVFNEDGQMMAGKVKIILENAKFNQEQFDILGTAIRNFKSTCVGASGAVYGLLIAFAFMFPNAELGIMFIPVPVKAKYFVPVYMLLFDGLFGIFGNALFGYNSGIAHVAHIGGALTGFIMMWYWKKNSFNENRWN